MLSRLIEFSLRQRALVLLGVLALAGAGLAAFLQLPIDAYPDISPTQVKLIIKAPGMTPEEVESRVITPLEMELLGVPRGVMLRSTAKYAIADITLDFAEGSDIYWARQQVAERYAGVSGSLPEGVSGGLAPISTPLSDVFMFTIEGGGLTLSERRALLDWTLRPALRTLPGVADVNVLGGEAKSFAVVPDRARLSAAGLSFSDVITAIGRNNRNDGAGRLDAGEDTLIVRAKARSTLDDLSRLILRGGQWYAPVRLGDVAQVRIEGVTRYGAVTRDGAGEAVEGIVVALRGADASALVKAIRARLDEVTPSLPPGVKVVPFYDRSTLIERAVGTVESALLEATVLVVILLLLFLGELRAALVVAVMVPLAALGTFLLMRLVGMSANLMSWGPRNRHRHAGGRCRGGGGKRRQSARPARAQCAPAAPAPHIRRGARGRHACGLGHPHHLSDLHAPAHAARVGRQTVCAGGADHRVRPGRLAAAVAHAGAGAGLAAAQGTRAHRAVGDALGHAPVPTAAGGCASPPATRIGGRHRGPGIGCGGLPRHGQGVHADDGRGRYPAATAKAAVHRVAALAGD
jgi:predicted RNA-binding protein with TRAM domain